jgi:hypothetical protein
MNPTESLNEQAVRDQKADETAELARNATRSVRELVRREADTLREELMENVRKLRGPALELGLAAVLGFSAFGMFLSSFGSQRRRGVLLLASTGCSVLSYVFASRAIRTAAGAVSFARTAEHVERAIDAAVSSV